jgi:hypothetical protein
MSNIDASWVYPTLITPAGWAFGIWGAIFGLQGCFTALQLLPQYRSKPLLVKGIKYHFTLACICQATWAVVFSRHMMMWSLLLTTAILFALVSLQRSIQRYPAHSISDFLVLKAPFHLHVAWSFVVVVLNVNMVIVQRGPDNRAIQIGHAVGSFVVLAAGAGIAVLRRDWWLPLVVSWTFWSIAWNLSHPKPAIEELIGPAVLGRFVVAAEVLATISSLSAAVLAMQALQEIRASVMLAPQLDFATEEFVTFSGPGTRAVRGSGHDATWRDNPSAVSRWWSELPSLRQTSNSEEDDGLRCEQSMTGRGR